MKFLWSWWGLLTGCVLVIAYAIWDWTSFKNKVRSLIFIAEEQAKAKLLETGRDKLKWVVDSVYKYLPAWLGFIQKEDLYSIVQEIFDKFVGWTEQKNLSRKHEVPE